MRVAVAREIVSDLERQRAVGIGEALELDVEVLADDAARAFAAHDVAPGDLFLLARRVLDERGDAVAVLLEAGEHGRHAHVDQLMGLGELQRLLDRS